LALIGGECDYPGEKRKMSTVSACKSQISQCLLFLKPMQRLNLAFRERTHSPAGQKIKSEIASTQITKTQEKSEKNNEMNRDEAKSIFA